MIRPFTCLCMLAAAGSGLYLYQTKHRAQLLDRDIAATLRQTDQVRDRIKMLGAEWALLNEPDRLEELARQHLTLKTLAPTQFVALADLPARLPAPLPRGTMTIPADEDAGPPAPPIPAPTPIAAARPPGPARTVLAANEKPADKSKPGQALAAAAPPSPASGPAPASAPASAPVPAPVAASPTSSAPAPIAAPAHSPAHVVLPAGTRTLPPQPAPRILAPIVAVSAGSIQPAGSSGHPLAPGTVGEAVSRYNRTHGSPSPSVYPATALAPAPQQPRYIPPGNATPYRSPAYVSTSSNGASYDSALGGAGQTHLPPPVPYTAGGG